MGQDSGFPVATACRPECHGPVTQRAPLPPVGISGAAICPHRPPPDQGDLSKQRDQVKERPLWVRHIHRPLSLLPSSPSHSLWGLRSAIQVWGPEQGGAWELPQHREAANLPAALAPVRVNRPLQEGWAASMAL